MDTLQQQLNKLMTLQVYLNGCPTSCLSHIVQAELAHINLDEYEAHPQIELRHALLQQEIERSDGLCIDEDCRCINYLNTAIRPEGPQLSIKHLNEWIYSQCLSKAISTHLLSLSATHPFSSDTVLEIAARDYKNIIYREALYFFEIQSLSDLHQTLSEKKKDFDRLMQLYVNNTLVPEIMFIETKLGITDPKKSAKKEQSKINLVDFKLQGTNSLFNYLGNLYELSLKNLKEVYDSFIKDEGKNCIDKDLDVDDRSDPINNVKFFRNLPEYLSKYIQNTESILNNVKSIKPKHIEHLPPCKTQSIKLKALRATVIEYKNELIAIEANETRTYINRNTNLIERRKQALATMEQCINQESTLTPQIKEAIITLVTEIKANKPHWKELPLLDKILDILSLGLNALIRYNTFKEHNVEKKLSEQAHQINDPDDNDTPDEHETTI